MARKPTIQRKPKHPPVQADSDIEAFLSGSATTRETAGGPAEKSHGKRGRPRSAKPKHNSRLSMPKPLAVKLDAYLSTLDTAPSRNAWIVEAIAQRLERESLK